MATCVNMTTAVGVLYCFLVAFSSHLVNCYSPSCRKFRVIPLLIEFFQSSSEIDSNTSFEAEEEEEEEEEEANETFFSENFFFLNDCDLTVFIFPRHQRLLLFNLLGTQVNSCVCVCVCVCVCGARSKNEIKRWGQKKETSTQD